MTMLKMMLLVCLCTKLYEWFNIELCEQGVLDLILILQTRLIQTNVSPDITSHLAGEHHL